MPLNSDMFTKKVGSLMYVALIASWIGMGIWYSYRSIIEALTLTASLEEYSYLTAIPFSLVFLLLRRLKYIKVPPNDSVMSSLLLALLLLTSSLFIYTISWNLPYTFQLQVLSMILYSWSLAVIALGYNTVSKMRALFLTSLLLIPIPRNIVDILVATLSRYMAILTAWIMGVGLEMGTYAILVVKTVNGEILRFEVSAACSGIVGLTGAIIGLPIILDIIAASNKKTIKKMVASIVATVMLIAGMLLGNLLRLILIVVAGKYWGRELALAVFHYTPSMVIAIIIAFTAVALTIRFIGKPELEINLPSLSSIKSIYPVLALAFIVISSLVAPVAVGLAMETSTTSSIYFVEQAVEPSKAFNDLPQIIKESIPYRVIVFTEKKDWEAILRIPIIYFALARTPTGIAYIYIEGSSNPNVFHGWSVCLSYQGYVLRRTWSEDVELNNNTHTIEFLEVEKNQLKGVVSSMKILLRVNYNGTIGLFYYRISVLVFSRGDMTKSYEEAKYIAEKILSNLKSILPPRNTIQERTTIDFASIYLVLTIIVFALNVIYNMYSKLMSGRKWVYT